jgi:DNA-binding HxlR family transcriptional regulator
LIVFALASGPMRLSRLKERLPGISTGVLEHHVQQMVALGLLSRRRFREMPPRVEVDLTDSGRELAPIAFALARWGMRHQWSAPHARERVEGEALLRQLPALLDQDALLPDGVVEVVLTSGENRVVRYCLQMHGGRLAAITEPGGESTASIEGGEDAWIAALGPVVDPGKLRFGGDERLARQIFEALARTRFAPTP